MKLLVTSLLLLLTMSSAFASEVEWKYKGEKGTSHWSELSEKFSLCSSGANQSPIDISFAIKTELPPLEIDYGEIDVEEFNNGHTVQVNTTGNNTFSNDAGSFKLAQFHFHEPSENTIDGKSFPLEAHFVNIDEEGRIAVLGVMFTAGQENSQLKKLWAKMPERTEYNIARIKSVIVSKLLPQEKGYYRFNGSLTTPPCTEGVRWFILKDSIEASQNQINKFHEVMGTDTNRPIQPINARVILK